jgi:ketopantoate hydroxymethyltransferase
MGAGVEENTGAGVPAVAIGAGVKKVGSVVVMLTGLGVASEMKEMIVKYYMRLFMK